MDATKSEGGGGGQVPMRTLLAAARLVGGEQRLAELLDVPQMQLACWLNTPEQPPRGVLLQALAIVMKHNNLSSTWRGASD